MYLKRFLSLFSFWLTVAYAGIVVPTVQAATAPTFPICTNPQGVVKVEYSEGTHGIVGSTATYTGSDAVYTLSDISLMQCFCAEDGSGIQTNWWRVDGLSQDEIEAFKREGWFFIPNGSLWGLANAPYLAKNNDYACAGGVGGADVQVDSGVGGDVLGLASTGNIALVYGMGSAGLGFLLLGLYVLRETSK